MRRANDAGAWPSSSTCLLPGAAALDTFDSTMNPEYSESGAPIYRYKAREPGWTPPNMGDSNMAEIEAHIESHIGKPTMVWHEIVSDLVHIDVHQISPTEDRPYWTLVTSGMSDLPMTVPKAAGSFRFCELMICLPKSWKMEQTDWKNEQFYWPVRWLKICARFPHEYKTWLSWGHTLPNGDPPSPFCASTNFSCMYLGVPRTVSKEFWHLDIRPEKKISFFALYPLYSGEVALKLKNGAEHIEELFDRNKISEIVDLNRKDLSQKPWWKKW